VLNVWASGHSEQNDVIEKGSVDKTTSMFLYSTIQFTAKWATKFDQINPGGFVLPNGKTVMVDMMELTSVFSFSMSCQGKSNKNKLLCQKIFSGNIKQRLAHCL
jgi:serine protease inhibitor